MLLSKTAHHPLPLEKYNSLDSEFWTLNILNAVWNRRGLCQLKLTKYDTPINVEYVFSGKHEIYCHDIFIQSALIYVCTYSPTYCIWMVDNDDDDHHISWTRMINAWREQLNENSKLSQIQIA